MPPRDWLRPRLSGLPSRRSLSPSGPRDFERAPLTMRLVARPATAEPMTSRVPWSPERLCERIPSTPPADTAAVSTRLPFSPPHPPGSLRARTASTTPARSAALRASAPRSLPVFFPSDREREEDDERSRWRLRALLSRSRDRERDLDLSLSFSPALPRNAPATPPRPSDLRTSSVVDLRRSFSFFGGGDRLREE